MVIETELFPFSIELLPLPFSVLRAMKDARVLGKIYSILYRVKLNWNVGLLLFAFSSFNVCLI